MLRRRYFTDSRSRRRTSSETTDPERLVTLGYPGTRSSQEERRQFVPRFDGEGPTGRTPLRRLQICERNALRSAS